MNYGTHASVMQRAFMTWCSMNRRVRFQARQALKKIAGKDGGDEPYDWKTWRQQ